MNVRQLARTFQSANWTTEFAYKLSADAPSQLLHSDCDFLARKAANELSKGRIGRARNWLALGLYLDSTNVLAHFKRVGFFRASKSGFHGKPLVRLVKSILRANSEIRLDPEAIRYFESVLSLLTLAVGALRTYHFVVKQLRKRKKDALKSLVATVDRMFLEPRPANLTVDCNDPRHYTIEDHADALSFLVHTLAPDGVTDDRQFDYIDEHGIQDGLYERLLVAACKLRVYQEAEILVDVFSYTVSHQKDVVCLRPDDPLLEQSIRLGYIHTEFQKNLSLLMHLEENDESVLSLQDFSKQVYETFGRNLIRRRDQPFPRYALFLPVELEELIAPFRQDALAKEDLNYLAAVAREQYARPETLLGFQLANHLTMFDVVKIRRFLNFLRDLMAQKLVPLMETDYLIAIRSLLPVFRKDKLLYLLSLCVSKQAAEAFLRIASYQTSSTPRIFDVLYQPLIPGRDHYLVPMNVLCSSDLLRNMLYTQRKNIHHDNLGSPIQHMVARALRKRFTKVAEGTRLQVDGRSLEIDILAVVEQKLLLIECKSAFHPCGVHELRTSYEHILTARKQLDRLREALERDDIRTQLRGRLQWNLDAVDGILTCVVTANRLFNGYIIGDHPIRPAHEMINLIRKGAVRIDDEYFCVWRNPNFEAQDLFDYLAGTTIHADMFGAFEDTARSYVLGDVTLNLRTYVLDADKLSRTLKTRYGSVTTN